jgi:hypothetical protein
MNNAKALRKKALCLSCLTVGYNIVEGAISIAAGALSGFIVYAYLVKKGRETLEDEDDDDD